VSSFNAILFHFKLGNLNLSCWVETFCNIIWNFELLDCCCKGLNPS
jgi:hypothetical protein